MECEQYVCFGHMTSTYLGRWDTFGLVPGFAGEIPYTLRPTYFSLNIEEKLSAALLTVNFFIKEF